MRRAFQIASTGKTGPAFVEFPADFNDVEIDIPSYVPSRVGVFNLEMASKKIEAHTDRCGR